MIDLVSSCRWREGCESFHGSYRSQRVLCEGGGRHLQRRRNESHTRASHGPGIVLGCTSKIQSRHGNERRARKLQTAEPLKWSRTSRYSVSPRRSRMRRLGTHSMARSSANSAETSLGRVFVHSVVLSTPTRRESIGYPDLRAPGSI